MRSPAAVSLFSQRVSRFGIRVCSTLASLSSARNTATRKKRPIFFIRPAIGCPSKTRLKMSFLGSTVGFKTFSRQCLLLLFFSAQLPFNRINFIRHSFIRLFILSSIHSWNTEQLIHSSIHPFIDGI